MMKTEKKSKKFIFIEKIDEIQFETIFQEVETLELEFVFS